MCLDCQFYRTKFASGHHHVQICRAPVDVRVHVSYFSMIYTIGQDMVRKSKDMGTEMIAKINKG